MAFGFPLFFLAVKLGFQPVNLLFDRVEVVGGNSDVCTLTLHARADLLDLILNLHTSCLVLELLESSLLVNGRPLLAGLVCFGALTVGHLALFSEWFLVLFRRHRHRLCLLFD
jgi:hypothetical protein